MANEAVLMVETELPVPINVADATGLEKGTCLQLGDNNVGTKSSGVDEVFGGITKSEKIADDGNTVIGVYYGGIFKMVCGTNGCTVGKPCAYDDAANTITDVTAHDNDLGRAIGKCLQTATSGETVLVFVGKF